MKTKWIIIGAACFLALALTAAWLLFFQGGNDDAPIDESVNLLRNAGFESVDEFGDPAEWAADMWRWDEGISLLTASGDAFSGAFSAMIWNSDPNDARFIQTVGVAPNAIYRIRAMVKADGCDSSFNGAGISVSDTFASSNYVWNTGGEWVELVLYGWTGRSQTALTVMARVGGYGSENKGRAWFDDFEMNRLAELPEGVTALNFEPLSISNDRADGGAQKGLRNIVITFVIALAFALAAALLARNARERQSPLEQDRGVPAWGVAAALSAAFLVRAVFAFSVRGYGNDMSCFLSWGGSLLSSGPLDFYSGVNFCDYPPGYMFVLALTSGVRALFGATGDTPAAWLIVKSVPILIDIASALIIYRAAKEAPGKNAAFMLMAIYAFNPAVIINSASWGQIDAVLTLTLVLSLMFAARKKWFASLPIFALAILIKPQALMLAPLGLYVLIVEIIRSEDRRKAALRLGLAFAASIGVFLAVMLPFAIRQTPSLPVLPFFRPFVWIYELYTGTFTGYANITVNACNLYVLLGLNWARMDAFAWAQPVALAVYIIIFGYVFFLYWRAKKIEVLCLLSAVVIALAFSFGLMMHERYIFPAILLSVLAYIKFRDLRLLAAAIGISAGQYINAALVLESLHLQESEQLINAFAAAVNVLSTLTLSWAAWDICVRDKAWKPAARGEEAVAYMRAPPLPRRRDAKLNMRRLDYSVIIFLTVIYAAIAFTNLGDTRAVQTEWRSSAAGEAVTFDLGEQRAFRVAYYGGICDSSFKLEFSNDGLIWSEPALAEYSQGEVYKWKWYAPGEYGDDGKFHRLTAGQLEELELDSWIAEGDVYTDYPFWNARYARLTAEAAGLKLIETAFIDETGTPYPIVYVNSQYGNPENRLDPALLTDEQHLVPAYPSYLNSMYFDEIYHARTAYEHLHGLKAYETTHPPLGKVFIMWGIQLFGMTPFGWRFMGTLMGVLMVPAIYLMIKQLLKRTDMAAIGAFLMAVDCMHFTQTRIATIDSYGVFFIMLMYLFMFRYIMMSFHFDKLWRTLVPLGLSGLFMGIGVACKWIGVYAAAGLSVLLAIALIKRFAEYKNAKETGEAGGAEYVSRYWKNLLITLASCLVFFVVIPAAIYYFSYYWHLKPTGGLNIKAVLNAQKSMLDYHSRLTEPHFYESPWYQWPIIWKPMWYFDGKAFMPDGVISSISAMGNPAVWWGGLIALSAVMVIVVRRRGGERYLWVIIGFASQYVPWMLVPRSMFIYHYFASVPFIIICAVLMFNRFRWQAVKWYKPALIAYLAIALILFIGFYPLMSGMPALRNYARYLRWFRWYNY
jgi:Gpi18-like mannosyltransferase